MSSERPSTWLAALAWVRMLRQAKHDEAANWLIAHGSNLPLCAGEPPRRGKAGFRQQKHDGTADVKWIGGCGARQKWATFALEEWTTRKTA